MKEILMSIFKSSEERLKNPFIGTFILSFLALNWKPIAILLFSELDIEKKINLISNKDSDVWSLIVLPVVIAFIYITGLPYLMLFFDRLTFWALTNRNSNLYKIKKTEITEKIGIAQAEIELENVKSDYKEKADLNNKIAALMADINLRDSEIETLRVEVNELKENLVKCNKEIDSDNHEIMRLENYIIKNELQFKEYHEDFEKTSTSIIKEFVNSLNEINRYINGGAYSVTRESGLLIERFSSMGLLSYKDRSSNVKPKLTITDKGLYFIKKAYQEGIF